MVSCHRRFVCRRHARSFPPLERERQANAATQLAAITFDVSERGLVPVARNHYELVAAALMVLLESRLAQNANILSKLAPSSFAGLSSTLLPWVLTGGTLLLHHPFDAEVLASQKRDDRCPALILPVRSLPACGSACL